MEKIGAGRGASFGTPILRVRLRRSGVEHDRAQGRPAILERTLAQSGLDPSDELQRFHSASSDLVGQRTTEHEGRRKSGKVVDSAHEIDDVDAHVAKSSVM
jgi:hypothetical protein